MREQVVIVGRITQNNRLLGGKFYSISTYKSYFICVDRFEELFNRHNVLNCKYYRGNLYSKWNKFSLKNLSIYNKQKRLIKQGYEEKEIISKAKGLCTKNTSLISGGRIVDPDSEEANEFAKKYYGQIRKMSNDVYEISRNTGKSLEEIRCIKNYIFIDKHNFLDGSHKRFDPDCAMAHSWQRLAQYIKEPIQQHDLILLEHELLEIKLVNEGIPQEEAHIIASEKYDYSRQSALYYKALKNKGGQNVQSKKYNKT